MKTPKYVFTLKFYSFRGIFADVFYGYFESNIYKESETKKKTGAYQISCKSDDSYRASDKERIASFSYSHLQQIIKQTSCLIPMKIRTSCYTVQGRKPPLSESLWSWEQHITMTIEGLKKGLRPEEIGIYVHLSRMYHTLWILETRTVSKRVKKFQGKLSRPLMRDSIDLRHLPLSKSHHL